MRTLFPILLLFILVPAGAQIWTGGITYLTEDSIRVAYAFEENWLFHPGDDSAWASPAYNDYGWHSVDPSMKAGHNTDTLFKGIGWFRLHVHTDSTITEKVLALKVTQYGASEIYLDGRKIREYGKVHKNKDSAEYYSPDKLPLPIRTLDTGKHVIAVRYANHYAPEQWKAYRDAAAGFNMAIGQASVFIETYQVVMAFSSVGLLLLTGFFLALALSHFFMWVYYPVTKSNLYFSIFCLAIGTAFFLPYVKYLSHDPHYVFVTYQLGMWVAIAIAISLSGVSNELFSTRKLRFKIIVAICLVNLAVSYFNLAVAAIVYILSLAVVALESIILTVRAIRRKARGARIIGVGILFSTLFIFVVLVITIINDGLSVEGDVAGKTLLTLFVTALLSIPISMSIYLAWSFAHITKNLDKQLHQVQLLSAKSMEQELEKQKMLENRQEELEAQVAERTEELEKQHEELKLEKNKSDELLRNILPEEVAAELKLKGTSEAKYFDHVSVIFTDFVDFTKAGERMTPQQLVDELHTCFKAFDEIISQYNIEKIKTIGDAYLAVCGLPAADNNHAISTVKAALEIRKFMNNRKLVLQDKTFDVRIGVHSGAVVAGIVGVKKFAYDIWGDTVNTAARMEQSSLPDKINISQTTYELVKDNFICTYRGEIAAKNKGDMNMYFVDGERT